MITLDLTNKDKSDIDYEIYNFPDSQKNVVLKSIGRLKTPLNCLVSQKSSVVIKSRMTWSDLQLIICATESLRAIGVNKIHLYVPFFLGSRSDIRFEEGSNNYLKQVICPIINRLKFKSVTVMDAHSPVLEGLIKNYSNIDNSDLVKKFFKEELPHKGINDVVLLSPDGGALKKIYKLADKIKFKGEIITCSKSRDTHGKLSKTNVPITMPFDKPVLIVDDLIDGGKTFIDIAKELFTWFEFNQIEKKDFPKLYLIVTHGIFSKGIGELQQYFECIYTTNSYKDFEPDTKQFIKQLDVF